VADYKHSLVNDGRGGQIPFPPFITQREMDIISNEFVVNADDIFVVTFPRSGTTWMEQVIHLLLNQGEQGSKVLGDAVPWVETLPNRPQRFKKFLEGMTGRRLFTSHLPYSLMPGKHYSSTRFVYVARNPKDVAVSTYYHDRSKHGYEGTWEEHLNLFFAGKVMYGSYFDHILPWWEATKQASNILFVKYEDMKQDLRAIILKLVDFLQLAADGELIKKVIDKSGFKTMANNPQTNLNWVPQKQGIPGHFRKGEIGDWRNHFTPEQNKMFDELYMEKMSATGLRFDFGNGFILP
jgi:sulfotransferase